jgi:prophage regulatory protein
MNRLAPSRGDKAAGVAANGDRSKANVKRKARPLTVETEFLRRADVLKRTTLGLSTLKVMVCEGRFPRPVRLGKRRSAWLAAEI